MSANHKIMFSFFNTRGIRLFIHNNSLLSNVISYLFFKAQACSVTEVVVDDAKLVQNFLPSSIMYLLSNFSTSAL